MSKHSQCLRPTRPSSWRWIIACSLLPVDASAQSVRVEGSRVPVRQDKVTVALSTKGPVGDTLQVVSREPGSSRPVEKEVSVAPGSALKAEIPADGSAVVKLPTPAPQRTEELPKAKQPHAALLVESVPDPSDSQVREIRQWALFFRAVESPLRWYP